MPDLPLTGIHLAPLILRHSKDERSTSAPSCRGSESSDGVTDA